MMELRLYEKLMLLAIDDNNGKIIFPASQVLCYGISGALIYELYHEGFIGFQDKTLITNDIKKNINDEILVATLEIIRNEPLNRSIDYWINYFSYKLERIKERIITKLVNEGILGEKEDKLFWIIPIHRFPTLNPKPEYDIKISLKECLMNDKEACSCDFILLNLVFVCNLLNEIVSDSEIPQAKLKMEKLINDYDNSLTDFKIIDLIIKSINNTINSAIIASVISN